MQTFLSSPNFKDCAKVLDNKRLRSQCNEAKVIYAVLSGRSKAWGSHCITNLWRNKAEQLLCFWSYCVLEARKRNISGYALPEKLSLKIENIEFQGQPGDFHSRYRSHLLSKNFEHYNTFSWTEEPKSGYWAIDKEGNWKLYSSI